MQKALKYLKDKQSSSFSKSFSFHQKKSSIAQDHSSILNLKKRVLLDNFAENLLNLELDIEQPIVSISSIYKLLQLYANGVEYYESIKSNRYLIFQDKIKNLLLKPNVIEALTEYNEKKNEDINSPSQKPMPDLKLQNVKEKKTLELNVYLVKQKSNDQDIKYIMEAKKNYVEKINKY